MLVEARKAHYCLPFSVTGSVHATAAAQQQKEDRDGIAADMAHVVP